MMRRYVRFCPIQNIDQSLTPSPSFFGTQEGDFSLTIKSIKAAAHAPPPAYVQTASSDSSEVEKGQSGVPDDSADGAAIAQRRLWRQLSFVFVSLALVGTFMSFVKCSM
jgi:hypothetical protein